MLSRLLVGLDGSSPHGRGTEHDQQQTVNWRRFIPAWAGNSRARMRCSVRPSVHPRMGGEQLPGPPKYPATPGSSPHGRGTVRPSLQALSKPRFIPAWAGNSLGVSFFRLGVSVHPRMGGEQLFRRTACAGPSGSSPHGRGTAAHVNPGVLRHRFIPAWAGNSRCPDSLLQLPAVHPRMGGEQLQGSFH